MKGKAHKARHRVLHKYLDELVADWIAHTGKLPSDGTVMQLLMWSGGQIENPTEEPTHAT